MVGYGIEGYDVLLTGENKMPSNYADKIKEKGLFELKLLKKTAYNDLIPTQENTACFQITEEEKKN